MFYMPMEMYPWEVPIDDKVYLQTLKLVITELAKNGMIVIRGRGSQFILKDFPGVFHILVVAPIGLRVERAMRSFQLDEESAKKQIKRSDDNHREFNKSYFHADTENPLDYDFVLNTKSITFEDATRTITRSIPPEKETKHLFSSSINRS
jgi:cytidylate kinase